MGYEAAAEPCRSVDAVPRGLTPEAWAAIRAFVCEAIGEAITAQLAAELSRQVAEEVGRIRGIILEISGDLQRKIIEEIRGLRDEGEEWKGIDDEEAE